MKIRIIEYKNIVDNTGKPMGHGLKVLKEAIAICKKMNADLSVFAHESYTECLEAQEQVVNVPHAFREGIYSPKQFRLIFNNINRCLKDATKDQILWFTNVDWILFAYLGMHKVKGNIVITEYKDNRKQLLTLAKNKGYAGSILRKICLNGMNKVSLHIQTYNNKLKDLTHIYMPDFIYYDFYKKYVRNDKINMVACLGTINNVQKDIVGMVEVFTKSGFPLLIAGCFVDEKLYTDVCKVKGDNIKIINKKLSEEEYYNYMASSKYIIVPYKMSCYKDATSGVVREALYLRTKVIAPIQMLLNMNVLGYGYNEIDEVPTLISNEDYLPYSIDLAGCGEEEVYENIAGAFLRFGVVNISSVVNSRS